MSTLALPTTRRLSSTAAARRIVGRAFIYLLIIGGSTFFVIPFLWMATSSVKASGDIFIQPPRYVPVLQFQPRLQNYVDAWNALPFGYFVVNSLTVSVVATLATTLTSIVVAFGFARLRFRGRDVLFLVVLSTMMLPGQVTLIPLFILFKNLGWVNTLKPLIVPTMFGNAFYIFLLRQFMMTIPLELEDAARIDGASSLGIWWRIMIPLIRPALLMAAVFTFQYTWTDYLKPLIYLNDENKRTLAVALSYFTGSPRGGPQLHFLMAASFLSLLPLIIVFFFVQRTMIKGIVFTGLKG